MKRRVLGLLLFLLIVPLLMACGQTQAEGSVTIELYQAGDNPETDTVETEYVYDSVTVDFTTEDTLYMLLDEHFELDVEESDFGRYITSIGNINPTESNEYVAFYIDGEYAMTGIDDTPLVDGQVYAFRLESY